MFEVISLSFAFVFGLVARRIGLPPMVGFLAAGFAIHAVGPDLGLPDGSGAIFDQIAHLGVLLLLFAVGLKLRLGQLAQPQVFGGALIHSAITTAIFSIGLVVVLRLDWSTALLLGVVLSFSSTVFSAKVLEAKRDIGAFYGRTAIGILIVQDIIALCVLALYSGQAPSPWALAVLAALPFLRPALHWLLDVSGHDELLVVAGMLLAVVVGGAGFEAVGLGAEIGALVMGLLLSTHPRAKELSDALWGLKEIFLVGFFLQIGMSGLPGLQDLTIALVLLVFLPLKGALFFALLLIFGLRARTAFLSAANLTAYFYNGNWRFSPAVGINYSENDDEAYVDSAGTAILAQHDRTGVASVSGQAGYTFETGDMQTVEVWAGIAGEWTCNDCGHHQDAIQWPRPPKMKEALEKS